MTAPDAGRGLGENERMALLLAWPWPVEAATTRDGFADVCAAVERILTARVAAAEVRALREAATFFDDRGDYLGVQVVDTLNDRADRLAATQEPS